MRKGERVNVEKEVQRGWRGNGVQNREKKVIVIRGEWLKER